MTATTYEEQESAIIVVVPVRLRNTWVVCGACDTTLHSRLRAAQLCGKSPASLAKYVRVYRSSAYVLIAVLSLLCAPLPIMGLVIPVPAILLNWRAGGWRVSLAWLSLAVTVLVHLYFLIYGYPN